MRQPFSFLLRSGSALASQRKSLPMEAWTFVSFLTCIGPFVLPAPSSADSFRGWSGSRKHAETLVTIVAHNCSSTDAHANGLVCFATAIQDSALVAGSSVCGEAAVGTHSSGISKELLCTSSVLFTSDMQLCLQLVNIATCRHGEGSSQSAAGARCARRR